MEINERMNQNTASKAMFFNGVCAASCGVVVALLQKKTGISYSEAGIILSGLSVGQLLSGFFSGIVSGRYGLRRTIGTMGTGLFIGYGLLALCAVLKPPFPVFCFLLSFILVGVGKGAVINVSNILCTKTSDPTKSLNLENAAFALGALLSPFIISAFANSSLPWWSPLIMLSLCGAMLLIMFCTVKLPQAERKGKINDFSFLGKKRFWNVTVLLFCQQCIEVGVTGWLVTYFQDMGILPGTLGQFTVSLIWGVMMIGRIYIAFFLKIKSLPRFLFRIGIGAMLSYIALLCAHSAFTALLFLAVFGLSIAGMYPVIVGSAGNLLSSESMGVMLPLGSLGAITMPSIMGFVAGVFGIHAGMMVIIFALVIYFVACIVMIKDDGKVVN